MPLLGCAVQRHSSHSMFASGPQQLHTATKYRERIRWCKCVGRRCGALNPHALGSPGRGGGLCARSGSSRGASVASAACAPRDFARSVPPSPARLVDGAARRSAWIGEAAVGPAAPAAAAGMSRSAPSCGSARSLGPSRRLGGALQAMSIRSPQRARPALCPGEGLRCPSPPPALGGSEQTKVVHERL